MRNCAYHLWASQERICTYSPIYTYIFGDGAKYAIALGNPTYLAAFQHFYVSSSTLLCRNGVSFSSRSDSLQNVGIGYLPCLIAATQSNLFQCMYLDWVDRDGARWRTCLRSLELILDEDVPSSVRTSQEGARRADWDVMLLMAQALTFHLFRMLSSEANCSALQIVILNYVDFLFKLIPLNS